jgi:hypothetical protein
MGQEVTGVILKDRRTNQVRAELLVKIFPDDSTQPFSRIKPTAVMIQGQDESQMNFQARVEAEIQTFAKRSESSSDHVIEFTYMPPGQDVRTTLAFLQRLDVIEVA